jgi:hypothetical protein
MNRQMSGYSAQYISYREQKFGGRSVVCYPNKPPIMKPNAVLDCTKHMGLVSCSDPYIAGKCWDTILN